MSFYFVEALAKYLISIAMFFFTFDKSNMTCQICAHPLYKDLLNVNIFIMEYGCKSLVSSRPFKNENYIE